MLNKMDVIYCRKGVKPNSKLRKMKGDPRIFDIIKYKDPSYGIVSELVANNLYYSKIKRIERMMER